MSRTPDELMHEGFLPLPFHHCGGCVPVGQPQPPLAESPAALHQSAPVRAFQMRKLLHVNELVTFSQ